MQEIKHQDPKDKKRNKEIEVKKALDEQILKKKQEQESQKKQQADYNEKMQLEVQTYAEEQQKKKRE